MKAVIIEDEPLLADELERSLIALDSNLSVIKKLTSVRDSISWLQENHCDIIFSDIELTDGLSFSIFQEVELDQPIVFTTAYDKYAIRAFELNSIGYLLKPYDLDDLERVLTKYQKYQIPSQKITELLHQLQSSGNEQQYLKRIILSLGNIRKPVSVDDIVFFMADDRYLFAVLKNGKKYYYDSTLAKLETEIDPKLFFRVNRKYLVNKFCVDEIIPTSKSRICLKMQVDAEEDIVVSYTRNNEFKDWLTE